MTHFKFVSLAILLGTLFGATTAMADAAKQAIDMNAIKAACQEEAKGALYPQEYAEECVNEKVEALKAQEQGQEAKDES